MKEALRLAEEARGLTSPNPTVGAVVVQNGGIVGRGAHTWAGVAHEEIVALREAGGAAKGASLYVTLEPCSHQGRTGPCVDAIVRAGVSRVIAPIQDPNPLVSGKRFERLRGSGIEVIRDDTHAPTAQRLNEPFIHFMKTGLPLVTVKGALTLD